MIDPNQIIFEWNMNEKESFVLKNCVTFMEYHNKIFPEDQKLSFPQKGDPRKSSLFRYCWKFVRETRGLLKKSEYELFIKAQLQIAKKFGSRREHAFAGAQILCGEKAWIRWKVWKKKYDQSNNQTQTLKEKCDDKIDNQIIKNIIKNDKKFLDKNYPNYNQDTINSLIKNNKIYTFLNRKDISYYYIIMSPFINYENLKLDIDLKLYLNNINDDVKLFFNNLFKKEFL